MALDAGAEFSDRCAICIADVTQVAGLHAGGVLTLALALGIEANTAIFTLIDAVMMRMLPIQKPEELQQVMLRNPRRGGEASGSFQDPLWEQIRDHQDIFASTLAWGN